jgi:hypothetical protein
MFIDYYFYIEKNPFVQEKGKCQFIFNTWEKYTVNLEIP